MHRLQWKISVVALLPLLHWASTIGLGQEAAQPPNPPNPSAAEPAEAEAANAKPAEADAAAPSGEAAPTAEGEAGRSELSGEWAEVGRLVESLRGGYQAISPAKVQAARADLEQAVTAASAKLNQLTGETRETMATRLHWDAFLTELKNDSPELGKLNLTLIGLYEDEAGMEATHWLTLREKLERFMYLTQYQNDPKAEDLYNARVDALASSLEEAAGDPSGEALARFGRILGTFNRYEQQEATVAKIREHFSEPNLVASVSAELASRAAARKIDRSLPVNDVILGTTIRGTAHTTGDISLRLLPSPTNIAAEVRLHGTAISTNRGWNRGVQINSSGTTTIDARKSLTVDRDGISTSAATADCETKTQINAICHDRKIVRKIAWKKACQSKGEAECIANRKAETRTRQELDKEISDLLAENRVKYENDVKGPLLRRNAAPQKLLLSSEPERIHVKMLQANHFQLAALAPAEAALPSTDVAVQLHESLIANLAEGLIGGVKLTDEGLVERIEESGREVPEELKIRDDTDPWSITFAQSQPVSVRFDRETIVIKVRGTQFTRGSNTVNREMEISAMYRIVREGDDLKLTRDGEVVAAYVKEGAESFGDIAVKTLMRTKFSALFKEEFASDGIPLPGPLEGKAELRLETLVSGQGWAVIGWNMADVEPDGEVAVATTR